jgi:hypothetical protein
VKSFIALSFVLLQLFTTTGMGELFKLPLLIQHYFEHDEKDDHQSFVNFILEHYAEMHATAEKNHADHHKKLPFHTIDSNCFNQITATVPAFCLNGEFFIISDPTVNTTRKKSSVYFHFLANIWQPPRA